MKPSTERVLQRNAPAAALTFALVVFGLVTWPRREPPHPPFPAESPMALKALEHPPEPVRLAKVVAECHLRITREELLKLADDCRSEWRGVSLSSYDEFSCYPGEGFDELDILPKPLYSVDINTYRDTKPGTTWIK